MTDDLVAIAHDLDRMGRDVLRLLLGSEPWDGPELRGLLAEYEAAQRRLRSLLHGAPSVFLPDPAHAAARGTLQAALVRELPIDRLLAAEGPPSPIEFSDDELGPVADDLHTWFSHIDYAHGKLNGAALVLRAEEIPPEAARFVDEIVECFAFQRYTAVYALARVALESSLRAVYVACGLADPDSEASRVVRERIQASGLHPRYTRGRHLFSTLTLDDFSPTLDEMTRRLCHLDGYREAAAPAVGTGTETLEAVLDRVRRLGNSVLHGNRVGDLESARVMMRDLFAGLHAVYEVDPAGGTR